MENKDLFDGAPLALPALLKKINSSCGGQAPHESKKKVVDITSGYNCGCRGINFAEDCQVQALVQGYCHRWAHHLAADFEAG
jgi:hypothetical protein